MTQARKPSKNQPAIKIVIGFGRHFGAAVRRADYRAAG
jgi:hypothetical protein